MNSTIYTLPHVPKALHSSVLLAQKDHNYEAFSLGSLVLFCISLLYLLKTQIFPQDFHFEWLVLGYSVIYASLAFLSLILFFFLRLFHNNVTLSVEINAVNIFCFFIITLTTSITCLELYSGKGYTGLFTGLIACCVLLSTTPTVYLLLNGWAFILFTFGFFLLHSSLTVNEFLPALVIIAISSCLGLVIQSGRLKNHLLTISLEAVNTELRDLSYIDALTQVRNRRFLMEFLEQHRLIEIRHHFGLTIIMLDLDHFKKVNDTLGHPVGDSVLIEVARMAKELLRDSDIIARYGGEEFIAVLPHTTLSNGTLVAQRIRIELENKIFLGVPWKITGSFGVAQLMDNETVDSLIIRVDQALYQAKESGRNNVVAR